ncbi:MAG: cell division protein ZapA [Muribaculaceae bacterium]|nr:cell division protein ZapA [Muribaculaceae bacterium]MDE6360871.1 cell division protein ZapA [Muribaculaceae bacterium]
MTEDKLNITIRIAGQNPVALKINRADEERVRNAEYQVNRLWSRWLQRFPDKNSTEVLAMVAYQFAELYFNATRLSEETNTVLEKFETELDRMLHGFGVSFPAEDGAQPSTAPSDGDAPVGANPWMAS